LEIGDAADVAVVNGDASAARRTVVADPDAAAWHIGENDRATNNQIAHGDARHLLDIHDAAHTRNQGGLSGAVTADDDGIVWVAVAVDIGQKVASEGIAAIEQDRATACQHQRVDLGNRLKRRARRLAVVVVIAVGCDVKRCRHDRLRQGKRNRIALVIDAAASESRRSRYRCPRRSRAKQGYKFTTARHDAGPTSERLTFTTLKE